MNFVLGQVGDVTAQGRGVVMHRLAHQDPSHVSPPLAVDGGMRIAFVVRKLVMDAVGCYPENRSAFEGQGGTPGQEVLHPLRSFISAMREQAVITHADAEAAGDPPQKNGYEECRPGKEK